jgi:hypothetical protein
MVLIGRQINSALAVRKIYTVSAFVALRARQKLTFIYRLMSPPLEQVLFQLRLMPLSVLSAKRQFKPVAEPALSANFLQRRRAAFITEPSDCQRRCVSFGR